MVIYYTDADMASFAMYMRSPQREESIKNHPNIDESNLENILAGVTQFDLDQWISLSKEAYMEMESNTNESNESEAELEQ